MTNATSSSCPMGETAEEVKYDLYLAAYEIFLPFYFITGICGHGICIFAFSKEYRNKEKACGFQILASSSDFIECISVSLCMLTIGNLSGLRLQPGCAWFQENYFLMWFTAHIAVPLPHTFITTSLLIYVNMAADRAFAIAWPFKHQSMNHKRHQILAGIVSLALGASTSIFDAFRYQVGQDGNNKYIVYLDEAFVNSTTASVCDILRNIIRVGGNILLIIFNITMVVTYRVKARRICYGIRNEHMAKSRRSAQKTLLLLTLFQSIFQTADMTLYNVFFTLEYSITGFADCYGLVMSPICDLAVQIAGTLELFAVLIIWKQFRRTIYAFLRDSAANILHWLKKLHGLRMSEMFRVFTAIGC